MRVGKKKTVSRNHGLLRTGLPALSRFCIPTLMLALGCAPLVSETGVRLQPAHPAAQASAPAPQNRPLPEVRQGTVPPRAAAPRPGQQHLPEWWNNHRDLTPDQQADALRREPGFRSLSPDQQQRLINRLHALDQKTPEQRQRILARNEAFERLSPERRQEVRGAAQALNQMPPYRQQVVRHAFQQLRRMPPEQRERLLNSGVYGGQFSPQERTVLGNLLSIEPYEAQRTIPQPYFGRP